MTPSGSNDRRAGSASRAAGRRPGEVGTVAIVGGGLAAASAAGTLREEGFSGRLVLVGAEPHLPYERPPLSKSYLAGQTSFADAFVHPVEFYDTRDIELRLGARATGLDLDAHTVTVGRDQISYNRLLLATGSSARRLPAADRSGATVAYLRTVEDSDRIKAGLRAGRRVVIVGGGWIGLEVAAAARIADCDVVVIEPLAEPLLRVLGPTLGRVFAALHRAHGVEVRTSTNVTAIRLRPSLGQTGPRTGPGDEDAATVHLDDGTAVVADLLVVGIGAIPNTELAVAAGLEVEDGVLADKFLRTSHPDVFVAGDLANAAHPKLGRNLRVEHWDNAKAQGVTAARNMLGADQAYDRLPYFFTDQYDLGMEYVGSVAPGGDEKLVLRGDPESGMFTAFWVGDGRVRAAMHANDWDATAPMRALVEAGTTGGPQDGQNSAGVDLTALRDPRVPLEQLVP
jgi:3-phenylpropionate/trans-cinnamate dioxygenase ferredoxin reductase subunit